MNLRSSLTCILIFLTFPDLIFAQLVRVSDFTPRRADTIILERNWRTRDNIILSELEFTQGDTVTPEILALSLKKIWNLQNFVSVDYRWDTLPDNRNSLILNVRDALTIAPVIAGNWQKPDVTAKLGITDRNFLGRNLRLELRAQYGESEPIFGEIKLIIPRQMLWRNMSIGAGIRKERVAGFNSDQAFISIVNPFHRDYQYTFSPDLEIGFNRSYTSPIFGVDPVDFQNVRHPFCFVRVTESVGTITHRRHQEEGFNLTGMIGVGLALNNESVSYLEGSVRIEYDKLFSRRLQFGARWEGLCNSSEYSYLWSRYGPAGIRGIEYGDLTGQIMHLASAGLYYTWIDRDFLAIEQSAFVQYATAWQTRGDWSSARQHYAIGTGFQFTIPMYPAASLLISFSYNPNRKNWFYLEL